MVENIFLDFLKVYLIKKHELLDFPQTEMAVYSQQYTAFNCIKNLDEIDFRFSIPLRKIAGQYYNGIYISIFL